MIVIIIDSVVVSSTYLPDVLMIGLQCESKNTPP